MIRLFSLIFILVSTGSFAQNMVTKEGMMRDLDIIESIYEARYAPQLWKHELFQWDLHNRIGDAKKELEMMEHPQVKDYQKVLRSVIDSMQDFHVKIMFYSTEIAILPFRIHSAQGRYFIADIYTESLPEQAANLAIGDEILTINGRSPSEMVSDDLKRYAYPSATHQSLAEAHLTLASGARGDHVPKGCLKLEVKSKRNGKKHIYRLEWDYYSEMIKSCSPHAAEASWPPVPEKHLFTHPFFHKKRVVPDYELLIKNLKRLQKASGDVHQMIGYKDSKLPALGHKIWSPQNLEYFDAYAFLSKEGKRVGFVRIPTFYPDDTVTAAKEFAFLIKYFQQHTDFLVIDMMGNPGGDYFYMNHLLSMLTTRPLAVPQEQVTLTQEDVMFAISTLELFHMLIDNVDLQQMDESFGNMLSGYPVDEAMLRNIMSYCEFIIAEWNQGHVFSDLCHIYGFKEVSPSKQVKYSKPILLLTDELDFSCADIFPAIMQDNKRATLMGRTTAGAGGYVLGAHHPNRLGIEGYTITGSLIERSNGMKIENLGVTPDIPYSLTVRDLREGFVDYADAIKKVLQTLK